METESIDPSCSTCANHKDFPNGICNDCIQNAVGFAHWRPKGKADMEAKLLIVEDPIIRALDIVVKCAKEGKYGNTAPARYIAVENDLNELLSPFGICIWFDAK